VHGVGVLHDVRQHGVATLDGAAYVIAVQERWRVHRDEIDIPTRAQLGDGVVVARRDDIDGRCTQGNSSPIAQSMRRRPPHLR